MRPRTPLDAIVRAVGGLGSRPSLKFTLLSRDRSIATGESKPAFMIRRRGVEQTHRGLVDAMDAGGGGA